MSYLWNFWLITAFVAPMFWALVNILDVYYVGEVFEDEFDGVTVSGLFQIVPWIFAIFIPFTFPTVGNSILAILAGILFLVGFYFYFKALFTTNDVAVVGIFWNISILILPIVAFIVLDERLSVLQYLGIFVASLGAFLISMDKKIKERELLKVFSIMMGAVSFLVISMIISDHVYNEVGFFDGFLLFSLGGFIGGVMFALLRKKFSKSKLRLLKLKKRHYLGFFIAESLSLGGTLFSQRTIDLSPAVSFVAAIESMQPFFILVFSAIIFMILSLIKKGSSGILKSIYREQLVGYKMKIIASFIIAIGIYMLNV